MKTRNSALFALGLAAAITLGGAASAGAQAKKKTVKKRAVSQKSIPVTKDVVTAKTDTVTVTRVDTVIVRRADTVTNTVMRVDTVTRMVYPPLAKLPGLFFGLGAGANIPMNDIRTRFKDSYAVQGQVGYFPNESMFGARVDGTWGKISHRDQDCRGCKDPSVWTLGGDLLLRFPLDRQGKLNPVLYFLGGGGYANFGDISTGSKVPLGNNKYLDVSGGHTYWDVGPGIDINLFGLHTYAEGRYMSISNDLKTVHMFPVYGGLKFGF